MSISHWPDQDKPREKLIHRGAKNLSDAELLAIFLRTGIPGKSAVDLGKELITEFGGLYKLLTCDHATLTQIKGLGTAKYAQLQAALEIGRRFLHAQIAQGNVLSCPADTRQYLLAQLKHHQHEVFACLFLNSQNQVIALEELFHGSLTSAQVHPREVVKRCLYHNAASVIFAHNHPSGHCTPSAADHAITQHLQHALALIDVQVHDHIVIGDTQTCSLAELGCLFLDAP